MSVVRTCAIMLVSRTSSIFGISVSETLDGLTVLQHCPQDNHADHTDPEPFVGQDELDRHVTRHIIILS